MGSNRVRLLSIRGLCIPRNGHAASPSSLVQTYGHHDYDHLCHHGLYGNSSHSTSARHCLPLLHHACVLLFYDHAITIFMILMTHAFSYLSLALPGLSLDPHSFDCSFLSRLCYLLTQPNPLSLSSFYFYLRCDIFGVTLQSWPL